MKSKDKKALRKKIFEEEDFIYCPRLSNSLNKLIEKNPSGVEDERIIKVLLLSEEEFEENYKKALNKLRKSLNIKEE